jgi:UDP-2,3-diacylglucosamine pyrophosphatase LpxH
MIKHIIFLKSTIRRALILVGTVFFLLSVCGCSGNEAVNSSSNDAQSQGSIVDTSGNTLSSSGQDSSNDATSSAIGWNYDDNEDVNNRYPITFEAVTLNLYDTNEMSYGITWNTLGKAKEQVVQVCEGSTFNADNCTEFGVSVSRTKKFVDSADYESYLYISKAVIKGLTAGKTYSYRCFDKKTSAVSDVFTFTANKISETPFKFAFVADSQVDTTEIRDSVYYANVIKGMTANGLPDFIIHGGDIAEYSRFELYWHNLINYNKTAFATIPMMPTAGNHDETYRAVPNTVFNHFNLNLPEQDTAKGVYYSFDYANTKFIVLATDVLSGDKLSEPQMKWLKNELENNTKKWTIVSMHYPMYTPIYGYLTETTTHITENLRNQLNSLFAEHGVDLVLQGHNHRFADTYPIGENGIVNKNSASEVVNGTTIYSNPNGVIYVMTGPAGNQSAKIETYDSDTFAFAYDGYASSWSEFVVNENTLSVKMYYYKDGKNTLIRSLGIQKNK